MQKLQAAESNLRALMAEAKSDFESNLIHFCQQKSSAYFSSLKKTASLSLCALVQMLLLVIRVKPTCLTNTFTRGHNSEFTISTIEFISTK